MKLNQEFLFILESIDEPKMPIPTGSIVVIPKHKHTDWRNTPLKVCDLHKGKTNIHSFK